MINENGDTWMLLVFLASAIVFISVLTMVLINWHLSRRRRRGGIISS